MATLFSYVDQFFRMPNLIISKILGGLTKLIGGVNGWWGGWAKQTRQDYRDFAPVHGTRSNRSVNTLFADGSVRSYVDTNSDGFLNNGFNPTAYTGAGTIGFTDGEIELPVEEFFSAYSLRTDGNSKGNLDTQ